MQLYKTKKTSQSLNVLTLASSLVCEDCKRKWRKLWWNPSQPKVRDPFHHRGLLALGILSLQPWWAAFITGLVKLHDMDASMTLSIVAELGSDISWFPVYVLVATVHSRWDMTSDTFLIGRAIRLDSACLSPLFILFSFLYLSLFS